MITSFVCEQELQELSENKQVELTLCRFMTGTALISFVRERKNVGTRNGQTGLANGAKGGTGDC